MCLTWLFTHSTPRHFSYLLKNVQQTLEKGKTKRFLDKRVSSENYLFSLVSFQSCVVVTAGLDSILLSSLYRGDQFICLSSYNNTHSVKLSTAKTAAPQCVCVSPEFFMNFRQGRFRSRWLNCLYFSVVTVSVPDRFVSEFYFATHSVRQYNSFIIGNPYLYQHVCIFSAGTISIAVTTSRHLDGPQWVVVSW